MIRKIIGLSLLLFFFALSGCGSSSNGQRDECVDNPTTSLCINDDNNMDEDDTTFE